MTKKRSLHRFILASFQSDPTRDFFLTGLTGWTGFFATMNAKRELRVFCLDSDSFRVSNELYVHEKLVSILNGRGVS